MVAVEIINVPMELSAGMRLFFFGLSRLDRLPQSAGGTGVQPIRGVDLVTPSDENGCTP